jgi:hypothetical protein
MQKAGLLGKSNLYEEVQDFTPDISQLDIHADSTFDFDTILPSINVQAIMNREGISFAE